MAETIAVIDDDTHINNMLKEVLTREGYSVIQAYSGKDGLRLLTDNAPDLVLLDLMMPDIAGERLLPTIGNVPVIVMSAKADVASKVDLLMSGAVDYITKPFETEELLARIEVQLRRNRNTGGMISYGGLSLNTDMRDVKFGDSSAKLTKTEFAILKILMQNPKQVLTKTQILDRISTETPDCVESSLKVHVSNLRRKLREISDIDFIEAVWGIGFKMRDIGEK